ncbi:MAG: N-acetylmuramoyl-L-alanine amidase [Desulfobacterales bacterium]|nr:N-acetylmuramoyl-L-alanine amidase [Desulfobacterales bacterium]
MTRDSDVFLTLEERTAFANKKRADLFVSIHINASQRQVAAGNRDLFPQPDHRLPRPSRWLPVKMRPRASPSATCSSSSTTSCSTPRSTNPPVSRAACTSISCPRLLNNGYQGKDHGIKQAPFYVLLGAQMPSILCELGFITNEDRLVAAAV